MRWWHYQEFDVPDFTAIGPSFLAIGQRGPTLAQDDLRMAVSDCAREARGGQFDAERMRSTAAALGGVAALVFPIVLFEKRDVHPPDHDFLSGFNHPRWVNQITPDDIPASVVVVRLQGPWAGSALQPRWLVYRLALSG